MRLQEYKLSIIIFGDHWFLPVVIHRACSVPNERASKSEIFVCYVIFFCFNYNNKYYTQY